MSILVGYTDRDGKLGAKIFNMALTRHALNNSDVGNNAFDKLCMNDLQKQFEPYRQKHITNGFGDIDLVQIKDRSSALIFAYRCNHKAKRY
jgi:hypothetical protein